MQTILAILIAIVVGLPLLKLCLQFWYDIYHAFKRGWQRGTKEYRAERDARKVESEAV